MTVGKVLQLTQSYVTLFGLAATAYLIAIAVIRVLAPGLKKVEFTA